MGLMKLLGLDFSEFKEKLVDTRMLYTSLAEGLTFLHKQHNKLNDKVELLAVHLEEEIKTQDDIIFDMRKKIEKLEKSSWKGKNK
jgi:predicted nuclease with TOPRIM domain